MQLPVFGTLYICVKMYNIYTLYYKLLIELIILEKYP